MGKLANVSSKPTVREYATGAAQDAMSKLAVASFLAPVVQVAAASGKFKQYSQKNRFRIPDTKRALGGRATELGFSASDANYNAEPNALDFPVDNLEALEGDDLENIFKEGADMAAEVGALSHEKDVVDKALTALGAGTAAVFSAGVDPIDFLDGYILNVLKAAKYGSLMGIKVLFGATAMKIVKNHVLVRGRITGNQKGATNLQVDEEILAGMLLTKPLIKTTYSVYDAAAEGLDESISFILDSNIIIFASKDNPTRRDPSFMKTFTPRGRFMVPGAYTRDDGRVEVAKFDWMSDPQVTNSAAAIRLNVTTA